MTRATNRGHDRFHLARRLRVDRTELIASTVLLVVVVAMLLVAGAVSHDDLRGALIGAAAGLAVATMVRFAVRALDRRRSGPPTPTAPGVIDLTVYDVTVPEPGRR